MNAKNNKLNWFEIPVTDFERGKTFYETIFGVTLDVMDFGGFKMGTFPNENGNGKLSGAICYSPSDYIPSETGVLIYLNCDPDLQPVLDKVESSGGKILRPKTIISPEWGFMAVILDSEGNRVALHSNA